MTTTPPDEPFELTYTADELRAAMRLIDPTATVTDSLHRTMATASREAPWLLPYRLGVALTLVSERLRRVADAWLERETPEVRAQFEAERMLLERVARGDAPPPGLGS
jgi:hypothetical protein